jgi:hypothetical protein
VTELDWCTHLAALDQVGVRFEDRIDLIRRRHLFAIEHTATRLVDDARAERAIMRNLVAQGLDCLDLDGLGDADLVEGQLLNGERNNGRWPDDF